MKKYSISIHCFAGIPFYLTLGIFILSSNNTYAQIDPPVLACNNGINDIYFSTCQSISNLNFSSIYGYTWSGENRYTWKLYKDGNEIESFVQTITCNICCNPGTDPNTGEPICDPLVCTCEFPAAYFFTISPISGEYKIRLIVEKRFLFIFWAAPHYDQYSDVINVTRFDDGAECSCDLSYDYTVNCAILSLFHDGGFLPPFDSPQPYTARAWNNLTANCPISSNNQPVKFIAGNKITLTQGFKSGNNFRAYLDICNDGIIVQKKGNDPIDSTGSTIDASATADSQQSANDNNNPKSEINNSSLDKRVSQTEIILQPNPTTGHTVIYFSPENINGLARLEITDVLGKTVFIKAPFATGVATPIDLSHLQKGIYFLKIFTDNEVRVDKVVIE